MVDFALDDTQRSLVELADEVLTRSVSGKVPDSAAWQALATADLLGVALPVEVGGGGFGFLELHLLLERIGAHAALVPAWETLVLGALPLVDARRIDWLEGVTSGQRIATAALPPDGDLTAPLPAYDGGRLTGTAPSVPAAPLADVVVVVARDPGGEPVVVVTDQGAVQARELTGGWPGGSIRYQDTPAEEIGRGGTAVRRLLEWGWAGLASIQAGVCAGALRLAASYTAERRQFGRPLATFQAVAHRLADAYIDTEALRLCSLEAAWRLSEGLDASEAVHTAKWWAAEAGHRVVHAALHVHGGVGVDRSYPLHRYLTLGARAALTLGGADRQLGWLGQMLAERPTEG